jgi:Pro-kumamolisin, activation domain/IPT/TIG domain
MLLVIVTLVAITAPSAAAMLSPAQAVSSPDGGSARVQVAAQPALPEGARLLGPVSATQLMSADLALMPRNQAGLEAFADAVTSTNSPVSDRYLSPGQFAAEFGPSPSAVRAVTTTLRVDGLTVGSVQDGGLLISFSGDERQIGAAFDTTFDSYRLAGGDVAYSETSAPTLPDSIASYLDAVVGLDDLSRPMPVNALMGGESGHAPAIAPGSLNDASTGPVACPAAKKDAATFGGLTDQAIANAYGVGGLYRDDVGGAGETIAVYEEEPFSMSDLLTFDTCYFGADQAKKIAGRVKISAVDGGQQVGPGSGEAILDMEDVTAIAPQAHYEVYEAPDTNPGYLDNYAQFVQDDNAQLLTSSWGECEPWDEEFLPGFLQVSHVLYEQAAAQGQTVLNAIGDTGSDCMEQFGEKVPVLSLTDTGDDPWVLGVGGTTITDASDPPAEQVWNDGPNGGGGGGGISQVWSAPAWQLPFINSKIVDRAEKVSGTDFCGDQSCREAPDVSAQADEFTGAVTVYVAEYGGWVTFGGTSSSSPLWAGVLADIGSTPACQVPGHELGFVVPKLYAVAANQSEYQHSFTDVTKGNNDVYGYADGLYPAISGYDMATGLGSPQVTGPGGTNDGLAYNLCNPTGVAPSVTGVDSLTNPGTNTVPVNDPGKARVAGTGFESGGVNRVAAVTVGNLTVPFQVTSATELTVRLPSGAAEAGSGAETSGAGTHNLAVTLTDGQTSAPSRVSTVVYYSTATSKSGNPVVDDVVASGTDPSGGQLFRVYGAGFRASKGKVSVSVGGKAASHVTVVNGDLLTADTPPEDTAACLNEKEDIGPGQRSFSPAVDTCQVQVQVTVDGLTSPEGSIDPEYQGPVADEPPAGSSTESYPGRTELDYLPPPKIKAVTVETSTADEAGGSTAVITGSGLGLLGFSWYDVGPYRRFFSANYEEVSFSPTRLVVTLPSEAPTSSPLSEPVMVQTLGSPNTANIAGKAPSNSVSVTYEPTPTLTAMRVLTAAGRTAPFAAGPTTGGTQIELVGNGFGPEPAEQAVGGFAYVAFTDIGAAGKSDGFSDATVTRLESGSETKITFDTIGDNPGIDQVSFCNVSGCTAPLKKGDIFRYYPIGKPSVSSVEPNEGAGGTRVVIKGQNLGFIKAVYFGTTKATVFANVPGLLDCGSTTEITATAPPEPGGKKVDIRVTTLESEATGYGKSPPNPRVVFTYR